MNRRTPTPQKSCLFVLTYYSPYVSGLTRVAQHTAEILARRGWAVTVVCSNHAHLQPEEVIEGVRVIRSNPVLRISKGTLSPKFLWSVWQESRRHRVAVVVAPLAESGLLPILLKSPYIFDYLCDVVAGPSVSRAIQVAMDLSHRVGLRFASLKGVLSDDYRRHSRLGKALTDAVELPPPCMDRSGGAPAFRSSKGLHVGFLGRIVSEKGLDVLVRAFLLKARDEDRLLIAGDYAGVAGGSVVNDVLQTTEGDPRVVMLGPLGEENVADFLASLDVLCLPSVNAFEAFGIVQVEALSAGCRVVASDLPGVRVPLLTVGGGTLVPPGDSEQLADAIWAPGVVLEKTSVSATELFGLEANGDRMERALLSVTAYNSAEHLTRPTWSGTDIGSLPWTAIKSAGVRVALFDVENTLARPGEMVDVTTATEFARIRGDLEYVALLSNSPTEWVQRVAGQLAVPIVTGRKPRKSTYLGGAFRAGVMPHEVLMVGDQVLTDIWGANRAGLRSALVNPLGSDANVKSRLNRIVSTFLSRIQAISA